MLGPAPRRQRAKFSLKKATELGTARWPTVNSPGRAFQHRRGQLVVALSVDEDVDTASLETLVVANHTGQCDAMRLLWRHQHSCYEEVYLVRAVQDFERFTRHRTGSNAVPGSP